MKYLKYLLSLLVVLLFFIPVLPLFHSGFFPIHDNTQVQRVFEMTKSLSFGMFPVRWVSDLGFGYGYPIFNFYAPLAYYFGSLFNLSGLDPLLSTKIVMFVGIFISGFSMYFLGKEVWGKMGGAISGLLYTFAPYHAVDIYVRGDVAEFWAYAFIPLVFYSLLKLNKTNKLRYLLLGAISYSFVVLSHNLTALMVTPFIFIFWLFLSLMNKRSIKKSLFLLTPLIFGLLISAFYWLSALSEMNFTNVISQVGGGADYRDHFVCFSQLWASPWGFGGSVKGCVDGVSFMIGKLHILLSLAGIVLFVLSFILRKKEKEKIFVFLFSLSGLLLTVFLTLDVSKPVWDLIKPMGFFQYPWRFLLLASFFISFIGGSVVYYFDLFAKKKMFTVLFFISLILAVSGFNSKYFFAQTYTNVSSKDFTNSHSLKWVTSNVTNEYMPKGFSKPTSFDQIPNGVSVRQGDVNIISESFSPRDYVVSYESQNGGKIRVPIAYFPFWKAELDGNKFGYSVTSSGISVMLPRGSHTLTLYYSQTLTEIVANIISVCGILALIIVIIFRRKAI